MEKCRLMKRQRCTSKSWTCSWLWKSSKTRAHAACVSGRRTFRIHACRRVYVESSWAHTRGDALLRLENDLSRTRGNLESWRTRSLRYQRTYTILSDEVLEETFCLHLNFDERCGSTGMFPKQRMSSIGLMFAHPEGSVRLSFACFVPRFTLTHDSAQRQATRARIIAHTRVSIGVDGSIVKVWKFLTASKQVVRNVREICRLHKFFFESCSGDGRGKSAHHGPQKQSCLVFCWDPLWRGVFGFVVPSQSYASQEMVTDASAEMHTWYEMKRDMDVDASVVAIPTALQSGTSG